MTPPARPADDDPARRPRTLGQRLQLLLILLILPGIAVALPSLLVRSVFIKSSKPKDIAKTAPSPDLDGLGAALNRSAVSLLPTPAPLTPEPLVLKVRADHLAARAEKLARQAQALGGTAVEGVTNAGEKHLFVDLPAGGGEPFRRAVAENILPAPPTATPAAGTAHDRLEVIIRAADDDE